MRFIMEELTRKHVPGKLKVRAHISKERKDQ